REGRRNRGRCADIIETFRSAPPREGRREPPPNEVTAMSWFRSAPPREGRRQTANISRIFAWFRSAPPREGRRVNAAMYASLFRFRSAPPREGRPQGDWATYELQKFRSAPPREAGESHLSRWEAACELLDCGFLGGLRYWGVHDGNDPGCVRSSRST